MGEVYRARHAMLRRPTAVKLLPLGPAAARRRSRASSARCSSPRILTHPNTVAVFDYGRTPDGVFYYAMEYLDGLNLDELVSMHGPQPPARVVAHPAPGAGRAGGGARRSGSSTATSSPPTSSSASAAACPTWRRCSTSAWCARRDEPGDASLTGANVITGTPLYLSPEAITSPDAVDARSDLYAVGGVAYYLLTGRYVFEGKTVVEVCGHQLHTAPTPPSERLGHAAAGRTSRR